jgi:hypothetical protein
MPVDVNSKAITKRGRVYGDVGHDAHFTAMEPKYFVSSYVVKIRHVIFELKDVMVALN